MNNKQYLMKNVTLLVYIVVLGINNVSAQREIEKHIVGHWYLLNPNLLELIDTLYFDKDLLGKTFSLWSFKNDHTLIISNGTLRGNNKNNPKCFSEIMHYKWNITKSTRVKTILTISMGKKNHSYRMLLNDTNKLTLLKDNYSNTNMQP